MTRLRFLPVLSLAIGCLAAQEASNIFEKAPPDVDQALRGRVTKFYEAFVSGKFRQADAFVAEDSKDVFFAMEKKRYKDCELGNIVYSDQFTKAVAVTSCDTQYYMLGRQVPVKLPITSQWRIENGEWFWYVIPISQRTTMQTPIGVVPVPPQPEDGQTAPPSPLPARPDQASIIAQVSRGVRVDRESIEINPTKASEEKIHITNALPGVVEVTVESGNIPGLTVKPAKADIGAGEEATFVIAFDPEDPAIQCTECLAHPQQARRAGMVTLVVEPVHQKFPVQINFTTPPQQK